MASFDEEEWFFRSVTEYEDLFMYELQNAAHCILWIDDRTICVACTNVGDKSELLCLHVPQKLTAKDQALCKDRDFQVLCGGFHDAYITDLKYIPHNRNLLSTEKTENCLRSWILPQSLEGIIAEKTKYSNCSKASEPAVSTILKTEDDKNLVASGSHSNNICILDLDTEMVLSDTAALEETERLSVLHWLDSSQLLTCSRGSGVISIIQVGTNRRATTEIYRPKNSSGIWSCDVSPISGDICLTSSQGALIVIDKESHKADVWTTGITSHTHEPSIKCCPTEDRICSISGLDGCVNIYKIPCLTESAHLPLQPMFTHQGHMANTSWSYDKVKVTSHMWHPSIPCLLLSAGNDGSLHAWKFSRK